MYEPVYTAGIVAGAASESNKLGYVYAFPIPQTLANINAFTLGAQSVNPAAETIAISTGSWCDPGLQAEAAKSLLDQGVDVITNDHGIIYSIYFRDPVNDIRLEITTTTDPSWSERAVSAHQAVAEWTATRDGAAARGESVTAALSVLATARKPGPDGH